MEQEQKQAITELAELLHKLGLSEIEYEANGVRLRIAGGRPETVMPQVIVPPQQASIPQPVAPQPPVSLAEPKKEEYIRSPMVGVAYLSKEENGPTFVKVGDTVSVGQTLCLVEAMKTYGADSFVGRLSCLFQGAADTTFYIIALYFGSVGIKKTRYAVGAGLIADIGGVIAAIFIAYLFFG